MIVEKVGDRYRVHIGTSDHHDMWQMLPENFEPDADDQIVELEGALGAAPGKPDYPAVSKPVHESMAAKDDLAPKTPTRGKHR